MPILETRSLRPSTDPWVLVAGQIRDFARAQAVDIREVLVLLPFAQHLPLARRAWAEAGGSVWMPRFETTQTLREGLPGVAGAPEAPSGDVPTDRLAAARLLGSQPWAQGLKRRDPAMYRHWVDGVVEMAQQFMRAAAAQAPALREGWWEQARELLQGAAGAGGLERGLARLALEWAAMQGEGADDALFGLDPVAWVVVQAGPCEPLVQSLLAHTARPVLRIETDPPPEALFDGASPDTRLLACKDFEDEAQTAAAEVLMHLREGRRPVAVIAQDRVLVRRVRALLERQQVAVRDETGWRLSTTRAAACVAGLLRLARHRASADDALDWLKSGFLEREAAAVEAGAAGLTAGHQMALEREMRRMQWASLREVDAARLGPQAQVAWQTLNAAVRCIKGGAGAGGRLALQGWNERLAEALAQCGARAALEADAAGQQVLAALHLQEGAETAFHRQAQATQMDLDDYSAWVDDVLEAALFMPPAPENADVVTTPLARAMLRPFAAVVMPGCDERHLSPGSASVWLGERDRAALGWPTRAAALQAQTQAFAQLLLQPRVTLLWRASHEGGPLEAAVLVKRFELARRRAGVLAAAADDPRPCLRLAAAPVRTSPAVAPQLLPARVSATGYEALRHCPYRFFALRMLGLSDAAELDDEIERSDYGTWLHAVMQAFHDERAASGAEGSRSAAEEVEQLLQLGEAQRAVLGLDEVAFLPYALRFRKLAATYVEWLHAHERGGAAVLRSEVKLSAPLPGRESVLLQGSLDRVDATREGGQAQTLVIDYKTGSLDALRRKQKDRNEDTQLAFYAALLQLSPEAPGAGAQVVRAMYLALEGREIEEVEHEGVADSAQHLLGGMLSDFDRIAAGAALPALGEGQVCEHCEARGLCRKDHWSEMPRAVQEVQP